MALLELRGLSVTYPSARGSARAVRDVSFDLDAGATLGVVGESGCGKSTLALAVMGLLPERARIDGVIRFSGQDLVGLDETRYGGLRGHRVAMIFQEPMTSLNPLHRVGDQVAEPMRRHLRMGEADARQEALRLLTRVRLPDPERCLRAYPHELSGGQRQRVMIAMALACKPMLLIADEPTTALDVTVQGQILDLLNELIVENGMALLLITHNLGVIAQTTERLVVMYGGRVVEAAPTASFLRRPTHPYSRGLLAAIPQRAVATGRRLAPIPGVVPELVDLPAGCTFAGRCGYAVGSCHTEAPDSVEVATDHAVRCSRLGAVAGVPVERDA